MDPKAEYDELTEELLAERGQALATAADGRCWRCPAAECAGTLQVEELKPEATEEVWRCGLCRRHWSERDLVRAWACRNLAEWIEGLEMKGGA